MRVTIGYVHRLTVTRSGKWVKVRGYTGRSSISRNTGDGYCRNDRSQIDRLRYCGADRCSSTARTLPVLTFQDKHHRASRSWRGADSTGHVEVMRGSAGRGVLVAVTWSGVCLDTRVERCGPLITVTHESRVWILRDGKRLELAMCCVLKLLLRCKGNGGENLGPKS
jgi:hypothetical protein